MLKLFTGMHAFFYRLTGGRAGSTTAGMKVLLLTTLGRKSGKSRTTPLTFFEQEGGFLIVASNAGKSHHPAWYLNLKSNPQVVVQIKDKNIPCTAEIVSSGQRESLWKGVVSASPAYSGYEKNTTREIPLVLLHPQA
jgi:F420H(2)-dependent quinone reductase